MQNEDKELKEGERLYLGQGEKEEERAHQERYLFALERLKDQAIVLDAACGSGYGSEILAQKSRRVIGLEVNSHACDYAESHHQRANIEFKRADLNQRIDLPDKFFDAIVSFETLEHVANQNIMLSEFRRLLKNNGRLIISTPDRELITDKAHTENKFHVAELSKKEFINLISGFFEINGMYGQIKYINLPWWKRAIKTLMKFFPRSLKRSVTDAFQLQRCVHKVFAPEEITGIEKVNREDENQYYHLIITAVSKSN